MDPESLQRSRYGSDLSIMSSTEIGLPSIVFGRIQVPDIVSAEGMSCLFTE